MSNIHCMIDLETMGLGTKPAIVSIGAVMVNIKTGEFVDQFYLDGLLESSVNDLGLEMWPSTVVWWSQQTEAARKALQPSDTTINSALGQLRIWFLHWSSVCDFSLPIWSNGATADIVWLNSAYKAAKIALPWSYRDERCYRTLKNLYPEIAGDDQLVAHNALEDAKWQGKHLIKLLEKVNAQ